MLKKLWNNKKARILVSSALVLIICILIGVLINHNQKETDGDKQTLIHNEQENEEGQDEPYNGNGLDVADDEEKDTQGAGVKAPTSWGVYESDDKKAEENKQNGTDSNNNSHKHESQNGDKEDGAQEDETQKDQNQNNDNQDDETMSETDDDSETIWGTVF